MENIGDAFKALLSIWAEMLGAFFVLLPRIIKFIVWALMAIVILPCVFIAGNIYPAWVEWGEDF